MVIALGSCDKGSELPEPEQEIPELIEGDIIETWNAVIIVDSAYNDRLNPESPAYFGDEYAEGVKVFYLCYGKKLTFLEYYSYLGGGGWWYWEDVENIKTITAPAPFYGGIYGYYSINCTMYVWFGIEDDPIFTYAYIAYPDGNEDEIKVQIKIGRNYIIKDKIWINGELAYDNYMREFGWDIPLPYYNPKYYHWLEPVFDNDGNEIGVRPRVPVLVIQK